jgi:glycosyltransferase involved in cell wall biosynthesis
MRVCLIANQIAAWGKIGGFGTATRAIGAGLARRGVEVFAVVPRRTADGQRPVEVLDGITVYGVQPWETLTSGRIFRRIQADIYHSQEPTLATWFAQHAAPEATHIVTCRDPRGLGDHLLEFRYSGLFRRLQFPLTWYYEASPWVKWSVRRADAVFCPAPCLVARVQRLYGGDVQPHFLPSPIDLPPGEPRKSEEPLVLFVGRWDRRKRVERFFQLARALPHVHFAAVGRAHEASYDRYLRRTYGHLPNLQMPGFVSRFVADELYRWYEKAWVLVNTSAREGLPYTFVEAAAWGCAILSCVNPDGYAEAFGYYAQQDDFESGLAQLLAGDWRRKGRLAAEHVRRTFSEENSLNEHLGWYHLLRRKAAPHPSATSEVPP